MKNMDNVSTHTNNFCIHIMQRMHFNKLYVVQMSTNDFLLYTHNFIHYTNKYRYYTKKCYYESLKIKMKCRNTSKNEPKKIIKTYMVFRT